MSNETFGFGEAIERIKRGELLRRKGWHGKGMHVYLEDSFAHKVGVGALRGATRAYRAHLVLVLPDGTHQPGWIASQTDLLAEDWASVNV